MRILINNKEIKYFDLNNQGKIIKTGDRITSTWERVYVDLDSIILGRPPKITFNKFERESQDLTPVYTYLNYPVTKIIKDVRNR